MEFISDEYRKLNSDLHRDVDNYGTGSFRWANAVRDIADEIEAKTILDYGCGKGNLKRALGIGKPDGFYEYDPAIPGKDADPVAADLVVCSDVLEHVERDRLLSVLEHLRSKSKKALFLVISTRESGKTLGDGRNAHLIVECAEWWKAQIGRFFQIDSWSTRNDVGEVVAVVRRLYQIGDIKTISAVSETIRFNNATVNLAKCPRRLNIEPVHDRKVTIVCYGPSLQQTWPRIAQERAEGNVILTVSGAHDFLISRGIVPDIHVDIDPREHKGYFTRNPHRDVKYWMASCCHPKVIDNLIPYDLTLWNVMNSEEDARIFGELEPDAWLVVGSGSVGCRAFNLMYTQGFRRFSLHGMDCAFADDGQQHAAEHSGKTQTEWKVTCNGRQYRTSGTLVAVAKGFIDNMNALEQASKMAGDPKAIGDDCVDTVINGSGLLAAMAIAGAPKIDAVDPSAFVKPEPDA